jgi:NodT family efflux transporter outer membrane factor (OMF) lipoprotein
MKRNQIKFLLIGLVAFSLQSCFVAKDYDDESTPDVVNSQNFRSDSLAAGSASIVKVSWRNMFTDTVLINHIEDGLENNIDIRVAIQQIAAAQAYFKQGKAGFFPSLTGNATYTHQELSGNSQFSSLFSSLDQYEVNAQLSWEADIWGKIRSQKRATQARFLQTVAAHKAVKTQLISNIASNYYQLLSLDEQLNVTRETVETRQNAIETIKALKTAGITNGAGVKQTEAQLYTAKGILIDLKKQKRLRENTLAILLGDEPHDIKRTELDQQTITTELKSGVPAQLLSNRPDVIAAEYNYRNKFEQTNVARSNFYPSITLSATGGFQSLSFDQLFDSGSLFATIIGGLTQPIFQQRKIRTQFDVAQAEQEQARLRFRKSFITASKEVSDALYSYEAATEKIDVKKNELQANQKATEYSQELLNNGLINYLEVLTARENALNSQLDLIQAQYNQLNSMVQLYEALGGGWQ